MDPNPALIFDFDGLIIDSETPLFEIWSAMLGSAGRGWCGQGYDRREAPQ